MRRRFSHFCTPLSTVCIFHLEAWPCVNATIGPARRYLPSGAPAQCLSGCPAPGSGPTPASRALEAPPWLPSPPPLGPHLRPAVRQRPTRVPRATQARTGPHLPSKAMPLYRPVCSPGNATTIAGCVRWGGPSFACRTAVKPRSAACQPASTRSRSPPQGRRAGRIAYSPLLPPSLSLRRPGVLLPAWPGFSIPRLCLEGSYFLNLKRPGSGLRPGRFPRLRPLGSPRPRPAVPPEAQHSTANRSIA